MAVVYLLSATEVQVGLLRSNANIHVGHALDQHRGSWERAKSAQVQRIYGVCQW